MLNLSRHGSSLMIPPQIGVFADCNGVLIGKLESSAQSGEPMEMEEKFCR